MKTMKKIASLLAVLALAACCLSAFAEAPVDTLLPGLSLDDISVLDGIALPGEDAPAGKTAEAPVLSPLAAAESSVLDQLLPDVAQRLAGAEGLSALLAGISLPGAEGVAAEAAAEEPAAAETAAEETPAEDAGALEALLPGLNLGDGSVLGNITLPGAEAAAETAAEEPAAQETAAEDAGALDALLPGLNLGDGSILGNITLPGAEAPAEPAAEEPAPETPAEDAGALDALLPGLNLGDSSVLDGITLPGAEAPAEPVVEEPAAQEPVPETPVLNAGTLETLLPDLNLGDSSVLDGIALPGAETPAETPSDTPSETPADQGGGTVDASGALYTRLVVFPTALEAPGTVSVALEVSNTLGEPLPGPVELFAADGNRVEGFGSPMLDAGETRQWFGTMRVTQEMLDAGMFSVSLKYSGPSETGAVECVTELGTAITKK